MMASRAAWSAPARMLFPGGLRPQVRTLSPVRSRLILQGQSRQFGQRFNYNRFQATKGFAQRWAQSKYFYWQVGGLAAIGGGFYVGNLETVPVSGRRRFNFLSDDQVQRTAQEAYREILQSEGKNLLPESHPVHRQVERVLKRLIPHTGKDARKVQWKVHVIAGEEENAFVLPGGKVFVYTGLLPVTKDDDGLAVVLGHELAHNIANHQGERMSGDGVRLAIGFLVSFAVGIGDFSLTRAFIDLAFNKPNSRVQESEADFIGLQIMSEACYDPHAAIGVWQRMGQDAQRSGEPPQWLSTHPASATRLQKFQEWLPAAELKREASGCGMIKENAPDFKRAFAQLGGRDERRNNTAVGREGHGSRGDGHDIWI